MANDDLSAFRKNWLKELEKQNHHDHDDDHEQRPGSSTSADHSSQDPEPASVALEGKNELPFEQSVQYAGEEDCFQNERSKNDPPLFALPVELLEEKRQGQEQLAHAFDGHSDASATYYPFRILTTLLNRASTEEGPKRARKRSGVKEREKQSLTETPKRRYFASGDEGDIPKKTKEGACVQRKQDERDSESKDYLDLFIADLNEISEIPFFDVSLPREVAIKIFWFLDIKDLCRCAQVSKSWRSLAEDELLWCRICHTLGFETDMPTVEHSNWKSRVRQYVTIKLTLELNWKGRTGKLHNLHHAKGGVLCAVHSHHSTIVAGYSNCQTKLWDVMSGGTCIFQPSSTALIIDETEEEGTISNEILHVATCHKVTAASYSHGFVDVWSNEEGTEPVYTFTCQGQGGLRQPSCLQLWEDPRSVYLSVGSGHQVQVHSIRQGEGGRVRDTFVFDSVVKSTKWLQDPTMNSATSGSSSSHLTTTPTLSIATNNTVSLVTLHEREAAVGGPGGWGSVNMLEVHNIVDAPVTCMDARLCPEQVAVGFTLNTGPAQFFRVDVYDILTKQMTMTLADHTACVLCVNMADSPAHQLVTGSRDRKVRVFDTRVTRSALMTLMGHSAAVTTVQMDEWKVVSGDEAGFVRVWDQRMARKLWEMNNRHPVRYCHFEDRQLVIGHVPYVKQHYGDFDFDTGVHQRHRGSLHMYDFLADQMRQGVPEICLSTYDEPQGYNYNIALAVPYDQV